MKRRRSRRPPSLASGLFVSFVTVILCLLAGEIVTRIRDPSASLWRYPNYIHQVTRPPDWAYQLAYDPELGWEPVPGVSGTLLGKPISFSKDGMRDQNLDTPPPTGRTIMALGDSLTEGYAAGNDETWPANLERLTGRRVLNAGVRGYGLDQIVLRAERIVPRLEPPTVVLAFIADDVARTALSVREAKGKPYFVPDGDGLALRNVPVHTALSSPWLVRVRDVLGYSHLLDYIMDRLDARELWYGDVVSTHVDAELVSCRLMERFARLVAKQHVKALVVGLPEQWAFINPGFRAVQEKWVTDTLACAAKAGLPTFDTFGPLERQGFGKDIDGNYRLLHFTDHGAAQVARLIAAALVANND